MVKTIAAGCLLLLIPASAYAQGHGHGHGRGGTTISNNPQAVGIGQATAGAASQSSSAASANNALTFNNPGVVQNLNRVRQSGSLRTTANAFAPQLVASAVNTCLGSAGIGVGVTGFGFSGGSTYPDKPCNLRMFSALLLSMGQKNAAAAILCKDPDVYAAFASVGVPCPIYPDGYRVVTQPAPDYYAVPQNGSGTIQVRGEVSSSRRRPEAVSYELQEARAAAVRLQDEYRQNGALR